MKNEVARESGFNLFWVLVALLLGVMAPSAFADGRTNFLGPDSPGVYFENNGQHDWVPLRPEQAKAAELSTTGQVIQAKLDRSYAKAVLYSPLKLAVRINEMEDIGAYRIVRLRSNGDSRTVRFNKPVEVDWVEIGFHLYELRLPANLPAGEYAVLPPGETAEHIYAFRLEQLPQPRQLGLAFR